MAKTGGTMGTTENTTPEHIVFDDETSEIQANCPPEPEEADPRSESF